MARFLLISALVFLVAGSAYAEDKAASENVIRIIRDDGSVVMIEMGQDGASTATVEGQSQPVPQQQQPEEQQQEEAAPQPETFEGAPGEPEQSYPHRVKPDVTEATPSPAPAPKKPKPKAAPKKIKPPKPAPEREIPEGTEITQDLATQIALDNAPPSSKFNVYRTALEGQQVYLVLFQTAEGPFEVVVDAMNGKVLSREHVRVEVLETKPGHLPPVAPAGAETAPPKEGE